MNTLIKTTIGVIALTLGSASMAHASKNRGYENDSPRHEKFSRNDTKGHNKKYSRDHKSDRGHNRHFSRHDRKQAYSSRGHHKPRHHKPSHHRGHHNKRSVKHVVRYESYSPYYVSDRHMSALMGGLIGSAIGHDMGRGDPAATASGALFGAFLGRNLSR